MRRGAAWLALLLALAAGCRSAPQAPQRKAYYGPLEAPSAVVDAINRNNAAVSTLWARGSFQASFVDGGARRFLSGDLVLLYRAPGDLRLRGDAGAVGRAFDLGINRALYWLAAGGSVDTMWYGRVDRADEVDPEDLPIRPDLLPDVLALRPVDTRLRALPAPTLRFDNEQDAWVLLWVEPGEQRWSAVRELWYDRASKRPFRVKLYDANGRAVVDGELSRHRPLVAADAASPHVPTLYRVSFPLSGARLSMQLVHVAATRNGAPNARSFGFPGEGAGVSQVISLDRDPPRSAATSPATRPGRAAAATRTAAPSR